MNLTQKSLWLPLVLWRIRCEWKRELKRSLLGMTWWFLEPLLYLLAFYAVFGLGFRSGTPGFVAFLLCGLVSWKWFSATLATSAGAITAHRNLIGQVRCPKWIFSGVVFGSNLVKFLILLLVLLCLLPLMGESPLASWWHLLWVIPVHGVFILGFSILTSALCPFLPDLRILINHGLIVLMFGSGLTFDVRLLDPTIKPWMDWNPVSVLFLSFRLPLLEGIAPPVAPLMGVLALGLLLGLLGVFLLKRWDGTYAKLEMY